MRRGRALAVWAAAVWVLLAVLAVPAQASVPGAIAALRTGSLYVDPAVEGVVAVDTNLSLPSDIKVAVLSRSDGTAIALVGDIGRALDPNGTSSLVVAVYTVDANGHGEFRAKTPKYCATYADQQAQAAAQAHADDLRNGNNLAAMLRDFAGRVASGPAANGKCPTSGSTATKTRGSSLWPWLIGLGVVGAGGIGALVVLDRKRTGRSLQLARANVQSYYERLANDINTLNPIDNKTAQQALADASERFTAAGGLLASADTVEEYAVARRTVLEGLYAARTARFALNIEPGPDLPPIQDTAAAPGLTAPQDVTVQGQTFSGYPAYTPGAPYYYGGGSGVPGGWYQTPFWETLLLGSVLSGGFGGGSDRGYDDGYRAGYEQGHDQQPSGGDSWSGGSFSGGDSWSDGAGGSTSGGGDSWSS